MADITLRFSKDMLVLSAPIEESLAPQGQVSAIDRPYLNLMESESVEEALRVQVLAGAQCVVTMTEDITKARLAHYRSEADASSIAQAALAAAQQVSPQHILAEIGPCGLPLDDQSKSSLNEHRKQYAEAAQAFGDGLFDAFFLNGFTSIADLKCALMGVRQSSDRPVFASVLVGPEPLSVDPPIPPEGTTAERILEGLPTEGYELMDGPRPAGPRTRKPLDPELFPEAISAMVDLEASVVGFETAEPLTAALGYVALAAELTDRPLLAQLRVVDDPMGAAAMGLTPLEDLKEYTPDTLALAARALRDGGVQFLRATGDATPACTGALAAAVFGLDAI